MFQGFLLGFLYKFLQGFLEELLQRLLQEFLRYLFIDFFGIFSIDYYNGFIGTPNIPSEIRPREDSSKAFNKNYPSRILPYPTGISYRVLRSNSNESIMKGYLKNYSMDFFM